jgi:diguanylate cyclase (GGDEF)-like protein
VVLDGTNLAGGALVAEKVRQSIADAPIRTFNASLHVTVSIGVSGLSTGADRADYTIESLLQQADRRLYASKGRGRNCITLPRLMPAIPGLELTQHGRAR